MKHLKLFFALFAMLALGVGNAWGAEASFTIKFKDNGTDASTALTATTFTNQVAEGANLIKSVSTSYCYPGTGGLKCSSNNNNGTFTLTLNNSYTVNKIVLSVKNKNATTKTVKVGSTSFSTSDSWNTTSFEDMVFSGTETTSDQITVSLAGTAKSKRVAYIASMTVYYKTDNAGSEEPVLSSIDISGDLTKKTYEEGDELDLTGLTVLANYESGDPKDVTNEVEWSYTPNPLTKGTTSVEVTATYNKDKTATTTITGLTVNEHIITPGEYELLLNNVFFGTTAGTSVSSFPTSAKQDDITVTLNGSGTKTRTDAANVRMYSGNTLTFSVPAGYVIKSIIFAEPASDKKWDGSITVNTGTYTDDTKTWTGSAQEVTYTFGAQNRIAKAIVTYIKDIKYALTITEPVAGTGTLVVKDGENALTSGAEIYEGTKLTVTATPETGYEEGVVVVKNASDEDITADVYAAGTLTMPAYAVTISATFDKKECTLLDKPSVSATTTYNSATLSWGAVTNAAKYSVKIGSTDAVETTETSYEVTGLNAETTYTYQVKAIAEADQDTYCDSEVAEGTFTTAKAPTATLTLKDIVGTTTQTGVLNSTITLPTTAAECSKTFVGWDEDENCDHAPTYARGAEYTLAAETQTLYAVYADGEAGEALQWTIKNDDLKVLDSSQSSGYAKYAGDQEKDGVTFNITSVMPATGENDGKIQMQAEKATIYNKTAMPGNIISIAIDGVDLSVYEGTEVISSTPSSGAITKNSEVYNFSSGKRYFHLKKSTKSAGYANSITVTYASAPTYSNYSTTCTAALEKPTFSVAEGTYTEAKSIELNATEGDVYYTLDGTEPTKSSTPYTAAINLDECGTTTIKAIAISTERKSSAASATYIINLPITNTAATAYTPTEATAIIDGACDKSEEVYVKGVVVSTSEFNATYGNYDVIVKAVDDNSATPTTFTFYRMYKAASNTKFTESDEVIGVGDIITAKGVLKKHNSTYELAEGCYMVERVAFTEPKTDISNTEATAYTVDKAFELISDVKSDLDKEVYVKGLVAVGSTELYEEKYLTYSISDNGQTTGNVLKVYDGLDIGGVAFASKDDVKVGDYVVVKGKLLNYKGTYEINKDNQLIEHISAATITIADITMEVGETKTIAATLVPAEAEVTYTIKKNEANAISLSGNVITANAVGTATITATATAADYMGKTVEFKVTVNAKSTKEKVVILAQYEGQWYAMKAQYVTGKTSHLAPLPVTYFDGKLYNVNEADKALIEWERAMVDGKATFYNDGKYLTGKSDKTDLTLAATTCEWTISEDSYLIGARTFLYNAENNWFRNFGTSNAGDKNYSDMPTVTAPVYATGDIVYTRTATPGSFSTICLPYAGTISGATLFDLSDRDETYVYVVEAGTELEAGKPYVILPTANEIVVTCKNYDYVAAGSNNALYGTYDDMNSDELDGKYVITGNKYYYVHKVQSAGSKLLAYRAYFNLNELPTAPASAPGVRRIALGTNGQNTATSMENVDASAQPVKMIINGQLFILRGEKMYDAQGKLAK